MKVLLTCLVLLMCGGMASAHEPPQQRMCWVTHVEPGHWDRQCRWLEINGVWYRAECSCWVYTPPRTVKRLEPCHSLKGSQNGFDSLDRGSPIADLLELGRQPYVDGSGDLVEWKTVPQKRRK